MPARLRLLTLALLFHATSSIAMPMLSADGSLLRGVDVEGTLYDVMFGDGVVGDVYAAVTFDATREAEANAVSMAIVSALNAIGGVSPLAISGCDVDNCYLFNPESEGGLSLIDRAVALGSIVLIDTALWANAAALVSLTPAENTSLFDGLTLVTYKRASSVPAPATVALFGLGLVGLGWSRCKKA